MDSCEEGKGIRTLSTVCEAAETAGIHMVPNNPVQVLRFSEAINGNVRLLELNPEVEKSLKQGDRVVIRGLASDEAILCTESKSFEVKVVETSNTMLLCRDIQTPGKEAFTASQSAGGGLIRQEVCGSACSYLELRPCRGHLSRLAEVLSEHQYAGPETEPDNFVAGYTFRDLLDLVQGSEDELWTGLKRCKACCIDGFWRLLSADYFEQAFDRIVQSLAEKDWPIYEVPVDECCELLTDLLPRVIIEHCLTCYGKKNDNGATYCLDEELVSQFYAGYLLRRVAKFNYAEFMEVWQQTVPLGITVALEMLKGIALHDLTARPPVVWHFPANSLPYDVSPRFNALFQERTKWTLSDLRPYIEDLATPQQPLEAILLKHTRSTMDVTGQKLYNSRHPL
ncbi:sister chromatid cohesion protein DCC1-like [Sycon ciliatum]|uniref:sister chromatid cohesion protein DCC1-like n=1 Tax=Sycon ciliatum TaxID=27933 RepID=UPI0031F63143|eukprot:scpid42204/ scgid28832/ Sister chromatid cohesion protein DCC1